MFLQKPFEISEQNISYYNGIAPEYNGMLDKDSDKLARGKVAARFSKIIHDGTILDFGGGTGLDLKWLTQSNNRIIFCEPSKEMRKLAISYSESLLDKNITFLNDHESDFRQWNKKLPFSEKADAILANFAVLNCIPDIEFLFKNLALIIRPGGHMVAIILTKKANNLFRRGIQNFFISIIRPSTVNIRYKNYRQTVRLYSTQNIIRASKKYFSLNSIEVLTCSGFTLMHLKRK